MAQILRVANGQAPSCEKITASPWSVTVVSAAALIDDRLIDQRPQLLVVVQVPRGNDLREVDHHQRFAGIDPIGGVVRAAPSKLTRRSRYPCGAYVFSKVVTTVFAYFDPGPTRNPWQLEHTPGGSSHGVSRSS